MEFIFGFLPMCSVILDKSVVAEEYIGLQAFSDSLYGKVRIIAYRLGSVHIFCRKVDPPANSGLHVLFCISIKLDGQSYTYRAAGVSKKSGGAMSSLK